MLEHSSIPRAVWEGNLNRKEEEPDFMFELNIAITIAITLATDGGRKRHNFLKSFPVKIIGSAADLAFNRRMRAKKPVHLRNQVPGQGYKHHLLFCSVDPACCLVAGSSWLQSGFHLPTAWEAAQSEGPEVCKLQRNTEKDFIFTAVAWVATS